MTTNPEAPALEVITAVDQRIEVVRTSSLDLSFNELLNMYGDAELIIAPEYQRLFRWSEGKQSRLIESLILEMPVPPLFVVERSENEYELIDGLQRLSSYINFRGELKDAEGVLQEPLTLTECDIVPELNGLTFNTLPRALSIKLKRSFIRVEVIRKESDPRLRYYMFKRLNTGGEAATEQEIRNCTIRLLDSRINDFVVEMSEVDAFRTTITYLSEEQKKQKYEQELVLRFFAFKNHMSRYEHNIGDFLTEYMEGVAVGDLPFNYENEHEIFLKTFTVLAATLGPDAFTGFNARGTRPAQFLSLHYEACTLGVLPHIERIDPGDAAQIERIRDALDQIKRDERFRQMTTGGGKNFRRQLEQRIGFVADAVGRAV